MELQTDTNKKRRQFGYYHSKTEQNQQAGHADMKDIPD